MSDAEQAPPEAAIPPPKRGFVANVLIVGGGTMIAQLVSLFTAPIVARLFGPEAFGIATIFGTVCAVVGIVGCLRYDGAILLPKTQEDGTAVLVLSVLAAFVTSALAIPALYLFGEPLLAQIGGEALWPFAWVIPIGILLQSLGSPLPLFAQRVERFDLVTAVRVISQLATIAATIAVGWIGFQTGRDLIFTRASTVMLLVPLPIVVWVALHPKAAGWKRPDWARIKAVAWRYREFPLVNAWAGLLDMLALQAPPLALAAMFSPTVVGLFAMAIRLVSLPCQFVSTAVGQVFFQHAAAAYSVGDKAAFSRSVDGVTRRLVTLGVLPVLLVALLGPPTIGLVFGERWLQAGHFVALLAPETLAMFITSPIVPLMNVLEMHRFNVLIQGSMLVLRAGSLWVGGTITGTPEGALTAFAITVPVGLALQHMVLLRASNVSLRRFVGHFFKHIVWALPSAAVWYALEHIAHAHWLVVATATVSAGVPYVWLAMREDPEGAELVWQLLARVRAKLSV
jgi:lipopolysaccharide exporter